MAGLWSRHSTRALNTIDSNRLPHGFCTAPLILSGIHCWHGLQLNMNPAMGRDVSRSSPVPLTFWTTLRHRSLVWLRLKGVAPDRPGRRWLLSVAALILIEPWVVDGLELVDGGEGRWRHGFRAPAKEAMTTGDIFRLRTRWMEACASDLQRLNKSTSREKLWD